MSKPTKTLDTPKRTIKFRLWDKKYKKFWHDFRIHPFGTFHPATTHKPIKGVDYWVYDYKYPQEHLVPLQFTGLLDKNGVEIYEHDLLYFKGQKVFCFYDDTRAIFSWAMVSEYDLWKLGHSPVGVFGIDELSRENNDELEVIGNIYEHPNLLKESE